MSWLKDLWKSDYNPLNLSKNVWDDYTGKSINAANVKAQHQINSENIEATKQNNALARQWAMEDFDRTNLYNSPQQQMQRLREAGLNPALVYGKGADNTAAMIRGSNPTPPQKVAPQMAPLRMPDPTTVASTLTSAYKTEAEVENIKAQTDLTRTSEDFKRLEAAKLVVDTSRNKLDLKQAEALMDPIIESMYLKNQAATQDIDLKAKGFDLELSKYDLQQRQYQLEKSKTTAQVANVNADTLNKVFQNEQMNPAQLAQVKATIENLLKDGRLKEFDLQLRGQGYNPSDNSYVRNLSAKVKSLIRNEASVPDSTVKGDTTWFKGGGYRTKNGYYPRTSPR